MAYELLIWKDEGISLDEWEQAVNNCSLTKIDPSDVHGVNPKTGEVITIGGDIGDAAVRFSKSGLLGVGGKVTWRKVFRFKSTYGSFNYSESMESPQNPIRIAAVELAKLLGARILGEGDEEYNW